MTTSEFRCTAPHPTVPRWTCRALLFEMGPEVEVRGGEHVPPGCTRHRCPRCGAVYVACKREAA